MTLPLPVAKKSLGQNFLVDTGVLDRIVEAITSVGRRHVVEVGPGTGVLTARLLDLADHVTAIEFDRDLLPFLQRSFSDRANFELVQGDILRWQPKQDYQSLVMSRQDEPMHHSLGLPTEYHLVGNIPYNLTTKLFEKILAWEWKPAAITFLMQKEVAEKIAKKGGKNSPLAIAADMLGEAKLLFDVPPTAFQPRPKVTSSVIQIRRQSPAGSGNGGLATDYRLSTADCLALYDFAHRLFRNPRKTLLNNLLGMMPKEQAIALLAKNNLDPMLRPERLSTEQVTRLMASQQRLLPGTREQAGR